MSNIMFSYITKEDNISFTFNRYINMVVHVLRKLGVDAKASGRNDIMIGDRKVSGNAFYHIPGKSIVHGTMLYDTNLENMVGSITPSDEKLVSKGVKSVRQHIALLKDFIDIDIEAFKLFVRNNLCDGEIMLTPDDVEGIKEIENREALTGKELLQRRFKNRKIELSESEISKVIIKMGFKYQTHFYHALSIGELSVDDVLKVWDEMHSHVSQTESRIANGEHKAEDFDLNVGFSCMGRCFYNISSQSF